MLKNIMKNNTNDQWNALHLEIVNHLEPQGVKLLYELFNFSYFFYWDCKVLTIFILNCVHNFQAKNIS